MRNFIQIAAQVDPLPVLQQLFLHDDLWDQHKMRTSFEGTPHVDVSDILLRFAPPQTTKREQMYDNTAPVWYPDAVAKLSEVRPIVLALMARVGAYQLDRLVITRMPPGGQILPHADNEGEYVHQSNIMRYHIVLQGLPGSLFHCGDETVCMKTGEVWAFRPDIEHCCFNNSTDDRIHMLADMTLWGDLSGKYPHDKLPSGAME